MIREGWLVINSHICGYTAKKGNTFMDAHASEVDSLMPCLQAKGLEIHPRDLMVFLQLVA